MFLNHTNSLHMPDHRFPALVAGFQKRLAQLKRLGSAEAQVRADQQYARQVAAPAPAAPRPISLAARRAQLARAEASLRAPRIR